jgi:hypothetical protein
MKTYRPRYIIPGCLLAVVALARCGASPTEPTPASDTQSAALSPQTKGAVDANTQHRPNANTGVVRIHVHRAANGQAPLADADVKVYDKDTKEFFGEFKSDVNGNVELNYGHFNGFPDNRRIEASASGKDATGTYEIYFGFNWFQYEGRYTVLNIWVFPV